MGVEFLTVIAGIIYLGVVGFFIHLILRFVRSQESIAQSVSQIADKFDSK